LNAIEALVRRPNIADLQYWNAWAFTLNQIDYTATSWQVLVEARNVSSNVLNRYPNYVTQAEVGNALTGLLRARDGLVRRAELYDAIREVRAFAEAGNESLYTPNSWAHLHTAYTNAVDMWHTANATQDQMNAALAAIEDAMEGLVRNGDRTALNAKLNYVYYEFSAYELQYTDASWAVFSAAFWHGIDVRDDVNSSQADVNAALAAILEAYESLVSYKYALRALIAEALLKQQANYTPQSWVFFVGALNAAIGVEANANATRVQIDSAAGWLSASLATLVPVVVPACVVHVWGSPVVTPFGVGWNDRGYSTYTCTNANCHETKVVDTPILLGDLNQDGVVCIEDLFLMIDWMFSGGAITFPRLKANLVQPYTEITNADFNALVEIVFS
jgi:hypothetical protein